MKKQLPILYILIVFLIAFWPIASFTFALKNDFFIGYFPPKFLLSETVNSGQFPLWNPYILFGLPFYADLNGAYWNPITWLIALTTGYSAYTLTIEILLYILLGGIGMHTLAKHYTSNRHIRIIAALSFMCNGFVVGHLQHLNWISCTAFLPWCIGSILSIDKNSSFRNLLIAAIFFYFLISASHPGMIIGAIYFFAAFIIFILWRRYKPGDLKAFKAGLIKYSTFLLLLALLSSGLIMSYLDILPHFSRNTKVDFAVSVTENTTAQSWISLLIPFCTTKNDDFFNNDIAFRNNYFGLVLLILFILSICTTSKIKSNRFYLLTGSFFLLLSFGGAIKYFALNYLPLIGYVRLNAEFRIFAIICFIISAIKSFDYFIYHKDQFQKTIKTILKSLITISSLLFFSSLLYMFKPGNILDVTTRYPEKSWRELIKLVIHSLQFNETILIQSGIQTILLIFLWHSFKSTNLKKIVLITAIDLILATNFNLPFTGVGKVAVAKIHSIHQQSPKGIPIPKLQPLSINDTIPDSDSTLVGEWTFYTRQIGTTKRALYPVMLKNTLLYYNAIERDSTVNIKNEPFLFLSSGTKDGKIINDSTMPLEQSSILEFTPNYVHIKFTAKKNSQLVYLQNIYPNWYYKTEGKIFPVNQVGYNFISVPVKKGQNDIEIIFRPQHFLFFALLSTTVFVLYLILAALLKKNMQPN